MFQKRIEKSRSVAPARKDRRLWDHFSGEFSSGFESKGLNVFSETQTKSTFKDEAKKKAFIAGAMG